MAVAIIILSLFLQGWTIKGWLAVAGVPSLLYCIQNLLAPMAYQVLDPFTFNVLNQTKTLSAGLCCNSVIGWKQSQGQILALFLLLVALVIEGAVPLILPYLDMLRTLAKSYKDVLLLLHHRPQNRSTTFHSH